VEVRDVLLLFSFSAAFNQTPGRYGMVPALPSEIALVFPKRNRILLFNGGRYHGVMVRAREESD
jgi:hypothetical protein